MIFFRKIWLEIFSFFVANSCFWKCTSVDDFTHEKNPFDLRILFTFLHFSELWHFEVVVVAKEKRDWGWHQNKNVQRFFKISSFSQNLIFILKKTSCSVNCYHKDKSLQKYNMTFSAIKKTILFVTICVVHVCYKCDAFDAKNIPEIIQVSFSIIKNWTKVHRSKGRTLFIVHV